MRSARREEAWEDLVSSNVVTGENAMGNPLGLIVMVGVLLA